MAQMNRPWIGSLVIALLASACASELSPTTTRDPFGVARTAKGEDGAEIVLVPAGEFWMGSDDEPRRDGPRGRVYLDAFYIDRYEVTNALFRKFVIATAYQTTAERKGDGEVVQQSKGGKSPWKRVVGASWRTPGGPETSADMSHPVVQVSWEDASAYCAWAGRRLPTEAEWEKAARGPDRSYPVREAWNLSRAHGSDNSEGTRPVGSYSGGASPYGAYDMVGNVTEWVADWVDWRSAFDARHYGGYGELDLGAGNRVLRGGSWFILLPPSLSRHRISSDSRSNYIGFRCARGLR